MLTTWSPDTLLLRLATVAVVVPVVVILSEAAGWKWRSWGSAVGPATKKVAVQMAEVISPAMRAVPGIAATT